MTCDTPCPLTIIKPTPPIQSETRLDKYLLRWFLEAAVPGYLTEAEWDALGEDWLEQARPTLPSRARVSQGR